MLFRSTIRDLVAYVFGKLNLNYEKYVVQDPAYYRAIDVNYLKGDSSHLKNTTGWCPDYTYYTMIDEMIDYWMNHYRK